MLPMANLDKLKSNKMFFSYEKYVLICLTQFSVFSFFQKCFYFCLFTSWIWFQEVSYIILEMP